VKLWNMALLLWKQQRGKLHGLSLKRVNFFNETQE
jgi:hypothetical protein